MKQKRNRAVVLPIAQKIVRRLEPYCERIAIAGSLRRGREQVGDIEIVALPIRKQVRQPSLLPDVEDPPAVGRDEVDLFLERSGVVMQKNGPLHKKFETARTQIQVDLFLPASPAHWGSILFIRTGSYEWNKWVMGVRSIDAGIRFEQGLIYSRDGEIQYNTSEEDDIFPLLGLPYIPPHERQDEIWRKYL